MKKIITALLALCMVTIIYFFIKEQFIGIVLSKNENILLAVTYLVTGISLIILFRIKHLEKKNH